MNRPFLAAILVGWWVSSPPACANDTRELVPQAVDAHAASIAAITTLRAKVTADVSFVEGASLPPGYDPKRVGEVKRYSGEFWRAGPRLRVTETEGPLGRRTVVKDLGSKKAFLLGDPGPGSGRPTSALITADYQLGSPLDVCDGWLYCLPRPVPPDYEPYVPLKDAVSKARKVTARRESLDGVDTVRLDLEMDTEGSRFEVWLDVGANYLFKRIVSTPRGRPGLEYRVLEFKEVKPGVYCPTKADRVLYRGTKTHLELTDIRVNEPIPDQVFGTQLAPGGLLTDQTDGKLYRAGADGQPKEVVGRVIQSGPGEQSAVPVPATPLTADEPGWWSWPRVVSVASIGLGIAAGVVWLRRRRSVTST